METELTAEDRELLQRLEEELWREETRFDLSRMEEVIAEDFFEFGRSGRLYQRADTLSVPSTPIEAVIPLPDFDQAEWFQSHISVDGKSGILGGIWSCS